MAVLSVLPTIVQDLVTVTVTFERQKSGLPIFLKTGLTNDFYLPVEIDENRYFLSPSLSIGEIAALLESGAKNWILKAGITVTSRLIYISARAFRKLVRGSMFVKDSRSMREC